MGERCHKCLFFKSLPSQAKVLGTGVYSLQFLGFVSVDEDSCFFFFLIIII